MDQTDPASTIADLDRVLRALKLRDLNQEGIPMFLVLEDLTANPAPEVAAGGRLWRLADDYFGRLVADRARASLEDVTTSLEILAAHHFDPVSGEDPVNDVAVFGRLAAGPLVRTINYHNTPRALASEVERQLMAAGERCRAVGEDDLDGLLSGRPRRYPEPPLMPVFYEGYRNNYDVALPRLERAGLRGWFFIPTAFIDTPVEEQRSFARAHHIGLTDDEHGDGRYAMTWDELRDVIARGHVVVCHTATHCAAADIMSAEDVQRELIEPRQKLEDELNLDVRTLAWLHGTPYGENRRIDAAVREAGYRLVVSNTKIQRIPGTR